MHHRNSKKIDEEISFNLIEKLLGLFVRVR